MSKKAFARKTFYLRKGNLWILQAIKELLQKADELGIRCTDSDVITSALSEYLKDYRKANPAPAPITVPSPVALKRTVTCPTEKSWLFERLDEIVAIKKATGVNTSFSFEICSLAAAALTGRSELGTITRDMLKNFKGKI